MTHIIESVGKWGIRTTEYNESRRTTPRPGDVVAFGENRAYPFEQARFGRVSDIDCWQTGTISICCEQGSVFLSESGNVSIGGGPFITVMPDELEPTFKLRPAGFWNWGDHWPAAHQGVDYSIIRPVFRLKLRTAESEARVQAAFATD